MTKYFLSEQVLMRLAGGFPDVAESVQLVDIMAAIPQVVNAMLKVQHFSVSMPNDVTIPDNLMIGVYEDIAVTSYGGGISKSKATLPIQPISLPRNMGIYQIYDAAYPDSPFIPIQTGQTALLKTDALLSDLLGQVSYEPKGRTITFSKDLPIYGVSAVTIELAVMDISLYSETDILPLPADYEGAVIEQLVKQFSGVVPENATVNSYSTSGNKIPKQLTK